MELSNIDVYENMVVNIHTIHKLMEYKNGGDALLLWFRYYEQRNIQWQKNTFSSDKFMIQAMWWWKEKFASAKKTLLKAWMIDIVNIRDDKTHKIIWWFVKVNYTFNPQSVRTHHIIMEISSSELQNPGFPESGFSGSKIQPNYNINNYSEKNWTYWNYNNPIKDDNPNNSFKQKNIEGVNVNGKQYHAPLDKIKNSDDVRELLDEDEISKYNIQLKILLKMIDLWYKVKKTKNSVLNELNWLKAKANLYNIKQADGNIAWMTFYQKIDKWYDWHTEKNKPVKNFKTSIIPFISK